jgi:hypothetical protein
MSKNVKWHVIRFSPMISLYSTQASGVGIPDESKTAYSKDLKMDKKHKYIIYRLSDDKKNIIIDKRAAKGIIVNIDLL